MLESAAADLPNDVDSLRALLAESRLENHRLRSTLVYRDAQIEKLLLQLARLKRMQFGAKSEKLDREIEQLELLIEELQTPSTAPSRAPADAATEKAVPARRPLPAHLPRESVVHAPAAACPRCGGTLRAIGEDISEMLDYVPAHWKVIRHVRPKCACDACQRIVQAEAPSRPIPRGIAAPGLLAHVLVSKYCDSLPLHRQSEIYARDGVEIERSTLADWVGGSAALLAPLVERLGAYVMSATKLHADDTPVPVLSPGKGQTRTGRLWTYVRDDRPAGSSQPPAVFFQYTPDRKGEHPRVHLKAFTGTLQADGYAGFHHLYETGRIREAACWAHVRRKFFDIHQANQSPIAKAALDRIAALYVIEKDIRGKSPDARRQHRQSRAGPLLALFQRGDHAGLDADAAVGRRLNAAITGTQKGLRIRLERAAGFSAQHIGPHEKAADLRCAQRHLVARLMAEQVGVCARALAHGHGNGANTLRGHDGGRGTG